VIFRVVQVKFNAFDRAEYLTLRLFKVPYTFCTFGGIDLVDLCAHVDRAVRTLWLANVTVDAFVGYA